MMAIDEKSKPRSTRKLFVALRCVRVLLANRDAYASRAWGNAAEEAEARLTSLATFHVPKLYAALGDLVSTSSLGEADFMLVPTQCRRFDARSAASAKPLLRKAASRVTSSSEVDLDVEEADAASRMEFERSSRRGSYDANEHNHVEDSQPAADSDEVFAVSSAHFTDVVAFAWLQGWQSAISKAEISLEAGNALPSGKHERDSSCAKCGVICYSRAQYSKEGCKRCDTYSYLRLLQRVFELHALRCGRRRFKHGIERLLPIAGPPFALRLEGSYISFTRNADNRRY